MPAVSLLRALAVSPPAGAPAPRPRGLTALTASLVAVMWAAVLCYVLAVSFDGRSLDPTGRLWWVAPVTVALPAIVVWASVPAARGRRVEPVLTALAMTVYASGSLSYFYGSTHHVLAYPSPAAVGFLTFYPLMFAAMACALRREVRHVPTRVWLDSVIAGLAAAAALAALLGRSGPAVPGGTLGRLVSIAYPLGDLLLVGTIVCIASLTSPGNRRHWVPLLAGLLLFTAADITFGPQLGDGTFRLRNPFDALWAIGLALMTAWIRRGRPTTDEPAPDRSGSLVIPALATTAGLSVLVIGTAHDIPVIAVALAAASLVAAAGRTQIAIRQLRRLADLSRQAATDDLTGLPNRRAFYRRGAALISQPDAHTALLLLDLDAFKEINDSLGHHVGDELLVEIGARLASRLRPGDLLARLGGDEFGLLLDATGPYQAGVVAAKLRAALAQPFTLSGISVRTDVSVGIAVSPSDGRDLSALLRGADIAMYDAKRTRSGYAYYDGMQRSEDRIDRLRTIDELRHALADDQLVVHYQPKVDVGSGRIVGVEALVRWDHPTRGLIDPTSFLSIAEDSRLMPRLTNQVLTQALDRATEWHRRGQPLTVAVNLSASSLVDEALPSRVAALLAERSLPRGTLQLEITEEFLMSDRDRARAILEELRSYGVQISIDDFGTGYSSLAYLRELPVDELKLDRSFVAPLAEGGRAAALVSSIIDLGHSLGLLLVAEGVEDAFTLADLAARGCDQAQGFFVSPAMPPDELDSWLAALPGSDGACYFPIGPVTHGSRSLDLS